MIKYANFSMKIYKKHRERNFQRILRMGQLSAADERMHLCRVLAKLDDTLFFLKIEKITCFVQFWGLFILDLGLRSDR